MEPVGLDAGSRYIMPEIFVPAVNHYDVTQTYPLLLSPIALLNQMICRYLFELFTFGIDMCHLNFSFSLLQTPPANFLIFATTSVLVAL